MAAAHVLLTKTKNVDKPTTVEDYSRFETA